MDRNVGAVKEKLRPGKKRLPRETEGDIHRKIVGGSLGWCLASDQATPGFMTLVDYFHSVLFVLCLARECKGVLRLAIGNLVDPAVTHKYWHVANGESIYIPEPLISSANETRKMPFDILDVVQLGREGIQDIDDDDLPVGLSLIEERHDTEDLYLLDLTDVPDLLTDLTDIERVVVALCLGLGVSLGGVFPSLR